jgi:prophage regulatory protein
LFCPALRGKQRGKQFRGCGRTGADASDRLLNQPRNLKGSPSSIVWRGSRYFRTACVILSARVHARSREFDTLRCRHHRFDATAVRRLSAFLRCSQPPIQESNVVQTSPPTEGQAHRLIRLEQVMQRTGLGRTATYEFIAKGQHPAPIKLGRASRWVVQEIDRWLEQLIHQRGLCGNRPRLALRASPHGQGSGAPFGASQV